MVATSVFSAHRCILAIWLVALLASFSWAQLGARIANTPVANQPQPHLGAGMMQPQAPSKKVPATETAKIVEKLLDTTLEFGEVDLSLAELQDLLSGEAKVPTFLDQRGLTIARKTSSTKIKANVPAMPLRSALRKMLEPLDL